MLAHTSSGTDLDAGGYSFDGILICRAIDKASRSPLLSEQHVSKSSWDISPGPESTQTPMTPISSSSQNSAPPRKVRKAVLPAAGLGTRFLPATKAQPKEMLTVVDKPQIQYVAEECVASGIEHIIIVTGRGKQAIEDHFDSAPMLETFLENKGKNDQVEMVREISNMVQVSYTRQKEPLGLGHAVLVARDLVGDEPFAVLLGDVLIPGENPATKQLIAAYQATGVGAIAVEEVPRDRTHLYGIVSGEPAPQPPFGNRLMRIKDLVEKPKPEVAPSNLAITGRYVLPPAIFDCLARTRPGAGNEIQLTDGLRLLAQEQGLWAYIYEGISYDAGDKLGFLKATVEIALQHKELGSDFRAYLKSLKL
jgi:UTP--glucose-1-phosphate uridylyltransferase